MKLQDDEIGRLRAVSLALEGRLREADATISKKNDEVLFINKKQKICNS
jgi:hypothetical protein